MFPQKRLKARFGATDGPFSSASCPPAEILSIPPAFVQAAWGSPHAWRTPCGARSHSARSSVSLLCNHFPEGKQGREHTLLISLKLHLKHTQSWVEGLGTTLLGAGFLPLNTHRALHWLFPRVHATCSSHLAYRRFWISCTCCSILVSRSVSSLCKNCLLPAKLSLGLGTTRAGLRKGHN